MSNLLKLDLHMQKLDALERLNRIPPELLVRIRNIENAINELSDVAKKAIDDIYDANERS